ncbi:MAG: hypothetical protein H6623_03740 [Bdellovibrionaceae bacterium]|nr:hypothetical protein [Pseudobdellovibrionaceae bacterium]
MIRKISLAIAMLGLAGFVSTAQAHVAGPVWTCSIDAPSVSGMNIGLGLSVGGLGTDNATITCEQPGKEPVIKKAGLVISGIGVGLGLSVYESFTMNSIIFGFASPNDLFGDYRIGVKAGVNLLNVEGGALATATLDNGVDIQFGLYGAKAYGLAATAQAIIMQVMTPEEYAKFEAAQQNQPEGNGSVASP